MAFTSSIQNLTLQSRDFPRLDLGSNDHLTRDIELVLAFDYRIDPVALETSLDCALDTFPHLTGRIEKEDTWFIEPKPEGVRFEIVRIDESLSTHQLEQLPLAEHRLQFIPDAKGLFGIRLTHVGETMSILGIRASHAAVDGTGLALFLHHCTSVMRGIAPIRVIHDRSAGKGEIGTGSIDIPFGYALAEPDMEDSDPTAQLPSTIFTIDIDSASRKLSGKSYIDTRLRLSAWMCAQLAAMESSFSKVAVWCDPRGLIGIPPTYTGNSGCYLLFQLEGISATDLTDNFRSLTTRSGFSRIAETHRQIQLAETSSQPITCMGKADRVIQLNLVPHAAESANFGNGTPEFGLMLSRNSSGLRITVTPDGNHYIIEACFEGDLGEQLFEACKIEAYEPRLWCQGNPSSEKPC